MSAYNICNDHVHMLLVCEEDKLDNTVRKLKGKCAQKFKEFRSIPKDETFHLWAQKYNKTPITSDEQLYATIKYINNNRQKHELPDISNGLQPIVQNMICDITHAFRTEYKGGFDVVIGNPPYGAALSNEVKENLTMNYICFKENFDIYSAFIQLAFQLAKSDGFWGFINPVSWQSGEKYLKVRQYLKNNGKFEIGIKLPYDVFEDAYVDTGIYIIQKSNAKNYTSQFMNFQLNSNITEIDNRY